MVGRCEAAVLALSFVALARATAGADVVAAPLREVAFSYTRGRGADACPSLSGLQVAVIAKLGYDPFQPSVARHLEVTIAAEGGMLRARLRLFDPAADSASVHQLVSSRMDCATLHPALTLAIALAIDPTTNLEVDAAPQLPPPMPPRPFPKPLPVAADAALVDRSSIPAEVAIDASRTPAAVHSAPTHAVGFIYGGGLIAIAAGPTTTGGFELGGGALWRSFSIAVELRGDIPTKAHSVAGDIEVGRTLLQVAPCFRAFAFGFCALGATGLSILRGHGYVVDRDTVAPYLAFGARLMADVPLGRGVWLGVHADLLGLATRVRARVDATVGYTDPPATGAFGFWLGGRFGDGR